MKFVKKVGQVLATIGLIFVMFFVGYFGTYLTMMFIPGIREPSFLWGFWMGASYLAIKRSLKL